VVQPGKSTSLGAPATGRSCGGGSPFALVLGIAFLVFIVVKVAGNAFLHTVVPEGQQSIESHVAVWIAACLAALCAGGFRARVVWERRQTTDALAGDLDGKTGTAHLLAPLEREGWIAVHDLRVPGSRANIDHVMLGPPGVLVVDSKNWSGTVEVTADTVLHSGRNRERQLAALLWEASAVDQALREGLAVAGIQAVAVVCVHCARVTRPRGHSDPPTVCRCSGPDNSSRSCADSRSDCSRRTSPL
jgi:hypothetical protein